MFRKIAKISAATVLTFSLFSSLGVGRPHEVEASTKLPDNHTIEQLKVKYTGGAGYVIDVGSRVGTLLIRVDRPKTEWDIEWVNLAISKPLEVAFSMYPTLDITNYYKTSPFRFSSDIESHLITKGYPDKLAKEAGILKSGLMKFSDFSDPHYYAGMAIYLDKAYSKNGFYWFGGDNYSLKEDGQVKAYFFPNQDVVVEGFNRIKKGGTFPLMKKVMWGKTELWAGQLGKVTVKKPTTLWKRLDNGTLKNVRDLQVGSEYRVYRYLDEKNGLYGVGAGMFVQRDTVKVIYETPSKRNLRLVRIMLGEE